MRSLKIEIESTSVIKCENRVWINRWD